MSSIIGQKKIDSIINVAEDEWIEHSQGIDEVIAAAKLILKKAKSKVYINADFPMTEIYDELQFLVNNNVEVYIFSFHELRKVPLGVNVYSHNHKMPIDHVCTRLMIAVDEDEVFLAENMETGDGWRGTRTNNSLLVKVVCEHIHNDIYLLLIRQKFGRNVYEEVDMKSYLERKEFL